MSGTLGWMEGEKAGWMDEENAGGNDSFDHPLVLIGWTESFHATSNDVDARGCAFRMVWARRAKTAVKATQQKSINGLA
jgi:hypothetical protein